MVKIPAGESPAAVLIFWAGAAILDVEVWPLPHKAEIIT
jgi:hypothetical protein